MNNASFVGSFTGESAAGVASLDPPLIQQTKSEIRTLAGEIAKLAHTASKPADFYNGFLPRLVTAMGAEGAAVWQACASLRQHGEIDADDPAPDQSLRLLAQHCLATELLDSDAGPSIAHIAPSDSHRRILDSVMAEGAPILVPPRTVNLDTDRPVNPLEHSIIVIPVRVEEEVEYVLEVVQRASGGPAAQRGYLRFVAQMADLMADYLRRQSLREHAARSARIQQFEFWLASIAQAPNPTRRLRLAADGLAELLESFQVFILRSGRRPKVLSASGLENFDPRSETILTAQLAERFLQKQPASQQACLDLSLWKDGDERLASVSKLYELLATDRLIRLRTSDESNVVAFLALPVSSIASSSEMQRIASSLFGLIDLHTAQANWIQKWFPARTSARSAHQLQRSVWQVWSMRAALSGLIAVIAFFPVPQQISTTAVLAPKEKHCYYAPLDATVTTIFLDGSENAQVEKGDSLLQLENTALNHSISRLDADCIANEAREEKLEFERNGAPRNSPQWLNADRELEQITLKLEANRKELADLKREKHELLILARESGVLTSWDLKNRLQGRPIARGDLLLSTCDPTAEWELQVSIPEHRVGLVSDSLTKSKSGSVPIRFTLTSHPNVLMDGHLTWMADQATRDASDANVVLSKAAVTSELPLKKEGTIARVTIDCGRVPAIWLVVRDAYWACMSRLKMIW